MAVDIFELDIAKPFRRKVINGMYKLEGMYAAIPTPFFEDERIDYEGIKTIVNYLAEQGLHGIIAGGSTGEYTMLSEEERKALIKTACEAAMGRMDVVAGTGCARAADTIRLCNYAAECGASAALVITPHYMVMTEDMLYDYYKTVAENSQIDIIIYHYALATGVMLSPQFVQRLSKIDKIVGLKNTEDMDHTAKVIALTADDKNFKIASGYDSLMIANLATGGDASMGVVHNIVPKTVEKIYACIKNNDVQEAARINAMLSELVLLLEAEPYPGPLKVAFDLMGLPGGVPRRPIAPPSDKMKEDMKNCLIKLGVIGN